MKDGIVAEVTLSGKSLIGQASYDYWALRNNGDFALLQSLFEDERRERSLFFDTRIVRVTEGILFLNNLYRHLGASSESRLTFRIGHRGIAGRTIMAAGGNRHVLPAEGIEDRSETQLSDTVLGLGAQIVEHVMQVVEPMFMLFDFKRFERSIYEDIVTKFASGRVS